MPRSKKPTKKVPAKNKVQSKQQSDTENKHAGGRPSKYNPKFCEQIIEFFSIEHTREELVITTTKNGSTREEMKTVPNPLPLFEKFAAKIDVHVDTMIEWTKAAYPDNYKVKRLRGKLKYPEFSEAYKKAKQLQKAMLVSNSLMGLYSTPFGIFTAKNITDWRDKQDHEVTANVTMKADDTLQQILSHITGSNTKKS